VRNFEANVDGSLSIVPYSVVEEVAVRSYSDIDEIVELNEQISYPSGFNAVTVYGYDNSDIDKNASSWLSVSAAEEDRGVEARGQNICRIVQFPGGNSRIGRRPIGRAYLSR